MVRCVNRKGISDVYGYLDDYIVVAHTQDECAYKMTTLIQLLLDLGFNISWDKVKPPSQITTYLGITIDSVKMELRLPDEKCSRLIHRVEIFQSKTHATYHATYYTMTGFGVVCDADWLYGVWSISDPHVSTGITATLSHHFCPPPLEYSSHMPISVLKLWPVIAAAARWGETWRDSTVQLYTDNTQVMAMIATGRSSNVDAIFWIRELFWLSFIYNFHIFIHKTIF